MSEQRYTIKYPRRVLVRGALRVIARPLFWLLSRTTVTGREHVPKTGPVILVGNHIAMFEIVLMTMWSPRMVEMTAQSDVPFKGFFMPLIESYGYIPIHRGKMDRDGLRMSLDVLAQDGVLGIFPEGGIWQSGQKEARAGAAWLSSKSGAPLVPMGFSGTEDVIGDILRLKRPRMEVHIGEPIPPVDLKTGKKSHKEALSDTSDMIMERIMALVPEAEKARGQQIESSDHRLDVQIRAADGTAVELPESLAPHHDDVLAKLLALPPLVKTLDHNLELPVKALRQLEDDPPPQEIEAAAQAILDYLDHQNPHFFRYRFGNQQGADTREGLIWLRDVAQWAAERDYRLFLRVHATQSD